MFNVPIVLIIFNRPHNTSKVFESIRKIKPKQLFVIADGPRLGNENDAIDCPKVLSIIDSIDWDCQVVKKLSAINLGCGLNISSGITWVFEQVDRAIILEDDCVPNQSFFYFCEELLEKYYFDEKIMNISGMNVVNEKIINSYYFSQFTMTYGWATWKRAWELYEFYPDLQATVSILKSTFGNNIFPFMYWIIQLSMIIKNQKKDIWDYQWSLCCFSKNGLSVIPCVNLVTNIGFGVNATHTTNENHPLAHLSTQEINFPLSHPQSLNADSTLDKQFQLKVHGYDVDNQMLSLFLFLKNRFKSFIKYSLLQSLKFK